MRLNRRGLLAGGPTLLTGAALAASAPGVAAADMPPPSAESARGLSLKLAKYVAETRFEDLPPDVVEMTKRSILDAMGVSLASSGLEPACQAFVELAVESGGAPQATILGMGKRAPVAQAAFANGSFAHAMDYEDSHDASRTHPNGAAVAAALAVAEQLGNVSGKDLILAVALGCDIVCRLGLSRPEDDDPKSNPPGFYRPAILGTFGAATAAAKLYKLSAVQVLDAWSLALCQNSVSAEILNAPDSAVRAVRDGFCAQSGVVGAQLAKKGVKGFDQPFEGKSGFFVMYMGGRYNPAILTAGLGKQFAGRDVAFKGWPSCRDTHLYIQAALELMKEHPIKVDDIATIEVVVQERNLIVCEPAASKKAPRTAIDAKFSVYFTVASALVKREIVFPTFWDAARADKEVLACAAKVSYRIDPKVANPVVAGGGVIMTVRMKDGTVYARKVQALSGSLEAPMPLAQLTGKFVDCGLRAAKPRPRAELTALANDLMALETSSDVGTLIRRV